VAEYGHVDASIPLSVRKPDAMGKLSDLLSMQRQAIAVQADKTALASAQQSQRQREGLASFDVSKIIGDDGTIDLNKIPGSGLREAAGDQYPQVLQQYATVKQQQLAAKQSLVQLKDAQRQTFGEMMGALVNDPDVAKDTPDGRQKIAQAFGQYAQMYGPDVEGVLKAYAAPIQNAPPGKIGQVLKNIQLQATSASDQATRQTPHFQYANTGARDVRIQTNPNAPGGVQMPEVINKELSPGERFPLATNAAGQMVRPDRLTGQIDVMGGANPTAAQAEMQGANVPRIQQAVTEAASVPQVRNVLQNIIKLADSVETGPKSEQVNRIKAMVGNVVPGASGWKDSSSAYQEMTKYMEQLALRSWASAGGSGTNTQLEAQIRANPNNEYNSKTVKKLAEWVLAGEEAKLAKTRSMMNWLQQPGNSVDNAEQFEIGWADAMDPRVFQLGVMGDKDEIKKAFSPKELADIRKSYERLKSLGAVQ
jgi:hypothetical protein